MFRPRDTQRNLLSARSQYSDLVGKDSFYALLADHADRLFPDTEFEELYCDDNGRPCVPPSQMFVLLLLQIHDKCSDAEAIERARCDIRWLAALDLELGHRLCGRTTLQEFRARIHLNEVAELQFKSVLQLARDLGVFKGTHLRVAIDTTPVLGRGAVKDTFNLIADGIRKVGSVVAKLAGLSPQQWAVQHDLGRYWDSSSIKGDAGINWSDEAERRIFLNGLVADAERLLRYAKELESEASDEDAAKIREASAILRRLLKQDTEPVPSPDAPKSTKKKRIEPTENSDSPTAFDQPDGPVQIRQGATQDRIISVHDPEIRHGRKSASKLFSGHKLSSVVDVDTGLILAVDIIAGNAPDNEGALDLVNKASSNAGLPVSKAIGDCAYGDGATRQAFHDAGIPLSAKVPSPPASDPFHKGRFILDLTNMIAACPAGQSTTDHDYGWHRHGATTRFVFPADVCQACPSREPCLRSADGKRQRGRTIQLHPQEELLQQARQAQSQPTFREDIKARQVVEHRQARLVQLVLRQNLILG